MGIPSSLEEGCRRSRRGGMVGCAHHPGASRHPSLKRRGQKNGGAMAAPGRSAIVTAAVMIAGSLAWVAGISYGFLLARRGNIDAHQINQTTWVVLNIGLIALVMAGSMQDVRIAKAAALADWRIAVTWLHAGLGTLTALSGLWIVLQMNNVLPRSLHVAAWKNLMRAAFAGYW